jgi:DNA mismatch endonuclease (patch repair protein)
MAKTYQKLPTTRRELAERALRATDKRNPHPTSLNARISMIGNVGRGTSPEVALRAALRAAGARGYRLNRRIEGVRPDIVFGPAHAAVFVHGCFWHRCPTCRHPLPRSHRDFWLAKFRRNRQRDRQKRARLERAGWRVIEVWEHEVRDDLARVVRAIRRASVSDR